MELTQSIAIYRKEQQLDFDAMDSFMTEILAALREDGKKAVRVFPPSAHVLLSFSERLAVEVVCPSLLPISMSL